MTDTATPTVPAPADATVAASIGTFDAYGTTFHVARKPPMLLISALARTDEADPEAIAVLYEFFETVMVPAEFRRFKRASYAADEEPDAFGAHLRAALEASMPDTPTTQS